MNILVINSGSSSIKFQLIEIEKETVRAQGLIERIGEKKSILKYQNQSMDKKESFEREGIDHNTGMAWMLESLQDSEMGVISDIKEINAVGHRIVHGGDKFSAPAIIDDKVIQAIKDFVPLAPLHNPAHLIGIEAAQKNIAHATQVAVFDTAFHQTLPEKSFRYALPNELYTELKLRRYGFHGTSHEYIAERCAESLGLPLKELTAVIFHLGNGASVSAIKDGVCVDTSMGLTPLEGLVMGTRSGDLDPAIHYFLHKQKGYSFETIDKLLNKQSGMKGLCGINDMREILAMRDRNDPSAVLALDIYAYRLRKYLGAYMAVTGPLKAVVFTAGIGENNPWLRGVVLSELEHWGIVVDSEKNQQPCEDVLNFSAVESKVQCMAIATNEELAIAQKTAAIIV